MIFSINFSGCALSHRINLKLIRLFVVLLSVSFILSGLLVMDVAWAKKGMAPKATGTVEILWSGGRGQGHPSDLGMSYVAEFVAMPPSPKKEVRGVFIYRVLDVEGIIHREITAEVCYAHVESNSLKAWFVAEVVSDIRLCSCPGAGSCSSSDSSGCSDSDSGGCSGGGLSGSGGGDSGGCSDGGSDGCSDTDSGGCSDADSGGCSDGGIGGSGGNDSWTGNANHVRGKESREGQFIIVKVHDKASPGGNGDGMTWKWFAPDDEALLAVINNISLEPKNLCKKTIIGGNLIVHVSS